MKKLILFASVLLPAISGNAQDYKLVWSDEFDTNTLNSNWNVEVVSNPANNELQYYTNRESNVRIEDGNLVLVGRRESYNGRSFTSGRVNSCNKVYFTHGKVEASIKLPYTARGLWPAFWMLGEDITTKGWPYCGEIDILESGNVGGYGGRENCFYNGALHWGPSWDQHMQYGTNNTDNYVIQDGNYHTFTCEWTDTQVICSVDGQSPYYIADIGPGTSPYAYTHKPYHILFNLAIGGDFPQIFDAAGVTALPNQGSEAFMYIDWVRVYQKTDNIVYPGRTTEPDPEPTPPAETTIPSAHTPDKDAAKVKSIYSDAYTAVGSPWFDTWGSPGESFSTVKTEGGDEALKVTSFQWLGLNINTDYSAIDMSAMKNIHMDIYAESPFTIRFSPVSDGQVENLVSKTLSAGWNCLVFSLSDFTGVVPSKIYQLKWAGGSNNTIYIDNIYFYGDDSGDDNKGEENPPVSIPAAPAPAHAQANVKAIYSGSYNCPELSIPDWAWQWLKTKDGGLSRESLDGDEALHLATYNFAAYNFASIDASDMQHFHIDIYPVDADAVSVHLNGDQNVFVSNTLTPGQWNSIDIPLSQFTAKGQALGNISMIKLTGKDGEDADGKKDLYVDNMYFHRPDNTTTSIESVENSDVDSDNVYYTIDGRRVEGPNLARGFYIQKGRKIFIK